MVRVLGCLWVSLWLASAPALAHRLQVFAFADGDRIEGSAYFAGGGAATGARIQVLDAQGRPLTELTPDGAGAFSYQAQTAEDHVVVAETGDGHRAEWRIRASELAPGFHSASVAPESEATPVPPPGPAKEADLTALVEQAVARQIRPLREELAAAQGQAALRDVLGGIGYILGLLGLLAWWRSRRASGGE